MTGWLGSGLALAGSVGGIFWGLAELFCSSFSSFFLPSLFPAAVLPGPVLPPDFALPSSGLLVCFLSEAEVSGLVLSERVRLAGLFSFLSAGEGEEDRELKIVLS